MNKRRDTLTELYSAIDSIEEIKKTWDWCEIVKSENNLQALRKLQKSMKEYVDNLLNL